MTFIRMLQLGSLHLYVSWTGRPKADIISSRSPHVPLWWCGKGSEIEVKLEADKQVCLSRTGRLLAATAAAAGLQIIWHYSWNMTQHDSANSPW